MLPKHPKQVDIVVYTKDYCPYCVAAKNLLNQKGVSYTEIDVTNDSAKQQEMLIKAAPKRTVPQIFIDGTGLGGFDDIKSLDSSGDLERFLFPDGR